MMEMFEDEDENEDDREVTLDLDPSRSEHPQNERADI
jgi:hypothetical protein